MAQPGNGKHTGRLAVATVTASRDVDAMWSAVDAARRELLGSVLAQRPPGGVTIAEYASRYRLNRNTAQFHLQRMVSLRLMRRFTVMLPDGRARITRTFVYVPIQKKERK